MNREQIEELAALDALGALDGDDVSAWQQLAAGDAAAARLREELGDIAARLSLLAAPVTAPDELRRRVMDAVFGDTTTAAQTESGSNGLLAWAAAAMVALLAVAGGRSAAAQRESVVVRDARGDAGAPFVALSGYGDYAGAKASVLWDSGQRGWWMQAQGLPALPASHRYRVWAIGEGDGQIYDCGELPVAAGYGRVFLQPGPAVTSMTGFAISVEPAGSKPATPGTPAILLTPALRG
ncbi:MAG: anti-sigma factor [Chthoniobacterales bacterium]|nr:anti-sigma factor [Chthoniobacterales bacterium]